MPGDDFDYPDALSDGPVRGRGAGLNPGNRFENIRLHVLGEHLDQQRSDTDPPVSTATQVLPDDSRSVVNYIDPDKSPDIPFRWSLNPYRGCEHGCIYCYARPTHELLGMSCGLDFETRILAKHHAPRLLEQHLANRRWQPQTIVMSGVTDPYQPVEAKLGITRGCLAVFARCRHPVSLVTKNRLILRDIDLLAELASRHLVHVAISLTTLDAKLAGVMEPRASSPGDRLEAMRRLSQAGVPVTAMIAPILPGLTDLEMASLLQAASEAGARSAGYVMLRLPYQIKALFLDWLKSHHPLAAGKVEQMIRQTRDGELYDATPGRRMRGQGPIADQIRQMFKLFVRKYQLDQPAPPLTTDCFIRPSLDGQMHLFE